jgi:hypothetical protein
VPPSLVIIPSASATAVVPAELPPSIKLISVAVAVTPSNMFNSAAVDVTVVLLIDNASVSNVPSTSTLPDISRDAAIN